MFGDDSVDETRLYPLRTRIFILFLAFEVVAGMIPGLPLAIAAVAMATRVRSSRSQSVALWAVATLLTIVIGGSLVFMRLGGLGIVHEGPVHHV